MDTLEVLYKKQTELRKIKAVSFNVQGSIISPNKIYDYIKDKNIDVIFLQKIHENN